MTHQDETLPRYVYVASSWRCETHRDVVTLLADRGIPHYDFRNPPNGEGFGWHEVMPDFDIENQVVPADQYLTGLDHPRSVEGFDSDFAAMMKADAFVLVLPCGRSAHLELGWAVGAGKRTAILLDGPMVTPELMYRMVDFIAPDWVSLMDWLTMWRPASLSEACVAVFLDREKDRYPDGMNAGDVLTEIRRRWGANAFALCTVIDVADEMDAAFGQPTGRAH